MSDEAMDERDQTTPGGGPLERLAAIGELLTTLDRKIVQTFETVSRVGAVADGLERLSEEGEDVVADLRKRLDRLDQRLHRDLDELKETIMDRLGQDLGPRFDSLERAVHNIDRAVTRLESLVDGVVETVPDFVTRRIRTRAAETRIEPTDR